MTDDEYIAHELNKAAPTGPGDVIRVKAYSENGGESRWVNIPADRFVALVAAASTPSADGKRCRHCSDELVELVKLPCSTQTSNAYCGANPNNSRHEPEES